MDSQEWNLTSFFIHWQLVLEDFLSSFFFNFVFIDILGVVEHVSRLWKCRLNQMGGKNKFYKYTCLGINLGCPQIICLCVRYYCEIQNLSNQREKFHYNDRHFYVIIIFLIFPDIFQENMKKKNFLVYKRIQQMIFFRFM